MSARRRIAFVVQRYGAEITGGSEQLCRQVAERLAGRHDVTVLTTCALAHETWANHYPPGESWLNGVRVHRFPVSEPRAADFDEFSAWLYTHPHSRVDEDAWARKQGPLAPELFDTIAREKDAYDAVFFFTYLFATTVFGLPLARERAILVPTAHDETPIHLGMYRELFLAPRHIVFLTPGEKRFVHEYFGNASVPWTLAGIGVEPPPPGSRFDLRRAHNLLGDVLLYVGRVEPAKGVDTLLEYFGRYRALGRMLVDLVLIGRVGMPLPDMPGVLPLGFVDEGTKATAFATATAFVMPCAHESLSIVTLESWRQGTPALVNAESPVLIDHCRASQGGLWYRDFAEFAAALDLLRFNGDLRRRLGANGRRYVEANYTWERIEARFERAMAHVAGEVAAGDGAR